MTTRTEAGTFAPSTRPRAYIEQIATHYYVLHMVERDGGMGGTNKAALAAYARKLGYTVTEPQP